MIVSGHRKRRSGRRLAGWDYRSLGAYFVTIVTEGRIPLFGVVRNDKLVPNDGGRMIDRVWTGLPERFPYIELGPHIVMPNHIHGIVHILDTHEPGDREEDQGDHKDRPYGNEGEVADWNLPPPIRRGEPGVRPDDNDQQTSPRSANSSRDSRVPSGTRPGSLGRVIQGFKSITTLHYIRQVKREGWPRFPDRLWQRNYYDRIIRDDDELRRIEEYIISNPVKWTEDRFFHPHRP